ncbi:MAG: methionine adenosyltransferase [Peptococcaceae bacterium]
MARHLFTSESVTEGHPDKLADQIADAILDEIIGLDPYARVACEVLVTTGLVVVAGEITTVCYVDIPRVVRDTIREIGYTRAKYGFDADTCAVVTSLDEQSSDIAQGVNKALEARTGEINNSVEEVIGAGDQGIMYGYATNETPEMMPLPISLAHKLAKQLAVVRKNREMPYLRPDGKVQVTVEYEDDKPVRLHTIVISAQHHPKVEIDVMRLDLIRKVIRKVVPEELLDDSTRYLVNPTGRFVVGGPQGDTGLTGRKNIVDTYGGVAKHGGGSFSGKDPTKVDRTANYAARYITKNIVAAGLAAKCEIQLAYIIGVARPVSIMVDTFGTGKVSEELLVKLIQEHFELTPAGMIKDFDLRRPIYRQLAAYGHFGRLDLNLPWERIDKAEILRQAAGM